MDIIASPRYLEGSFPLGGTGYISDRPPVSGVNLSLPGALPCYLSALQAGVHWRRVDTADTWPSTVRRENAQRALPWLGPFQTPQRHPRGLETELSSWVLDTQALNGRGSPGATGSNEPLEEVSAAP